MQAHPWFWFLCLFIVPLVAVLAWFVLVCWIGALAVILSQVL